MMRNVVCPGNRLGPWFWSCVVLAASFWPVSGRSQNTGGDPLAVASEIYGPEALAVDNDGGIFVYEDPTDWAHLPPKRFFPASVRRIDLRTHTITTVVKGCDPPWVDRMAANCVNAFFAMRYSPRGELIFAEITGALRAFDLKNRRFAPLAENSHPHSIAVTPNGVVIGSDDYRIRFLDFRTGVVSIIGGTGKRGYSGDGGPAIQAQFSLPVSVAADSEGNVFVSDDNLIRKIDRTTGLVKTVVGSADPRSLAFDPSGRLLYLAGNRVERFDVRTSTKETIAGSFSSGYGGDGAPAKAALIDPNDMAVDNEGDIYIADSGNNRVRRIDAQSGIITTVGGNGLPHRGPEPVR